MNTVPNPELETTREEMEALEEAATLPAPPELKVIEPKSVPQAGPELTRTQMNVQIWQSGREVPDWALSDIEGGRLRGMSNISPIWRLQKLTAIFGPVGVGWTYERRDELVPFGAVGENGTYINGELLLKVHLNFSVKMPNDEWSAPFTVTGSAFQRVREQGQLRVDDDADKKALTEAIGQACKMFGIGADVYAAGQNPEVDSPALEANPAFMSIWNRSQNVPSWAVTPIQGGRMQGLSNINPIWRLQKLTELFGPIGSGWKYERHDEMLRFASVDKDGVVHHGEMLLKVHLDFSVNMPKGGWTKPFRVTGCAFQRVREKNGLRIDDDADKKALTDALGQACKMFGIGARVYAGGGDTRSQKYR